MREEIMDMFDLSIKDIEEKISKNIKAGLNYETLRKTMLAEKNDLQRSLLRQEAHLNKLKLTIQNMDEVIQHIDTLIEKRIV